LIPALLLFALLQEAPPAAQQDVMEVAEMHSQVEGDEVVYRIRGLHMVREGRLVDADRALLKLDREKYRKSIQEKPAQKPPSTGKTKKPGNGDQKPKAHHTLTGAWQSQLLKALGLPPNRDGLLRYLLLEGNVQIEGPGIRLLCDKLENDAVAETTVVTEGDLLFSQGQGPSGWPLRLAGHTIREEADGSLHAVPCSLTTCTLDHPHYALQLSELHATPLPDGRWSFSPSGGWLVLGGSRIIPVPTPDFESGEDFLGLKAFRIHSDKALGSSAELEFASTAKLFHDSVDLGWSFQPTWSTRRGFPLRAGLDIQSGIYHGSWDLFYLNDRGDDVHRFRQSVARDSNKRWRLHGYNRFELGDDWRLDADLALSSDPLVDPEFFTDEFRRQRDAETELYLRHATKNDFFSADATIRLDDQGFTPLQGFRSPGLPAPRQLENLPVLRFDHFSGTIFELPAGALGGADGLVPIDLSWGAELARQRRRDRQLDAPPALPPFPRRRAQTRDRARVWTELAAPVQPGGFFVRPGVRLEGAAYGDDVRSTQTPARFNGETFVEVGSLLVKDYDNGWQHRVLPEIRFRDRRVSGAQPPDHLRIDQTDFARTSQVTEFSLRQFFVAPETSTPWMDLEVLLPFYPSPDKPLDDGIFPAPRRGQQFDHWGPLEARLVWTPGTYGKALKGVRAETRVRQNFHTSRIEEVFSKLTISPSDRLTYSVSYRKLENFFSRSEFTTDWRISEDWGIRFLQQFNFTGRTSEDSQLILRHYTHDVVFEVGLSRDQSAGQSGFFFNVQPRFLADNVYYPRTTSGRR